jgi:quercetin dioxygenase-like cupin family protein
MKSIAPISCLFVLAVVVYAQSPMTTSPQYYKVLFENDQVRVFEYRLKPHEIEPMHSHPTEGIVYVLTGARLKFTIPDRPPEERSAAAGEVIWREPVTHSVENVGDTEARAIVFDLKATTKH